MKNFLVTVPHGSGGADTAELLKQVFVPHFQNEVLSRMEDSAAIALPPPAEREAAAPGAGRRLAVSTDTFVVQPLVFPGGDIGRLAVFGTVNDVLMSGATPRWLTCGFVLETGLPIGLLDTICASLAKAAAEAGVTIIAGDTKVVEGRAEGGGLIINTTGIGTDPYIVEGKIHPGDTIIVSGPLGDHHAAILSARLGIKNEIKSDCALLAPIVHALRDAGIAVHAMRDVTRGGLGTILNELASASNVTIALEETAIPVRPEVRAFCGVMGLDPIYMGNEGKLVLAVAPENAAQALALVRGAEAGTGAAIIGRALSDPETLRNRTFVTMKTRVGGTVRVDILYGEGLPRIC